VISVIAGIIFAVAGFATAISGLWVMVKARRIATMAIGPRSLSDEDSLTNLLRLVSLATLLLGFAFGVLGVEVALDGGL
jgi:hypothetical protein